MILKHAQSESAVDHGPGRNLPDSQLEGLFVSVPFPAGGTVCAPVTLSESRLALVCVHLFDRKSGEARFLLRGDVADEADLGKCLVQAESLALSLGAVFLVSQEKVCAGFAKAPTTFRAAGFEELDESWTFECPFTSLAVRGERVYNALRAKDAIPENISVDSVDNRFSEVRFILDNSRMMDSFDFDARLSGASPMPISRAHSRVVCHRTELVGILLVALCEKAGTYEVPTRWVSAKARRSWVNAALLHSCIAQGRELGAEFIRFNANAENHRETIRLAEHANGTRIGCSHRYGKRID